jgi:hypothetical protein
LNTPRIEWFGSAGAWTVLGLGPAVPAWYRVERHRLAWSLAPVDGARAVLLFPALVRRVEVSVYGPAAVAAVEPAWLDGHPAPSRRGGYRLTRVRTRSGFRVQVLSLTLTLLSDVPPAFDVAGWLHEQIRTGAAAKGGAA